MGIVLDMGLGGFYREVIKRAFGGRFRRAEEITGGIAIVLPPIVYLIWEPAEAWVTLVLVAIAFVVLVAIGVVHAPYRLYCEQREKAAAAVRDGDAAVAAAAHDVERAKHEKSAAEDLLRLKLALEDIELSQAMFERGIEYLSNRSNWTEDDINQKPDTTAFHASNVLQEKMELYLKQIKDYMPEIDIDIFNDSDMPSSIKDGIAYEELGVFRSRGHLARYYRFQHGARKFDRIVREAKNRIVATLNRVRAMPISLAIERLEAEYLALRLAPETEKTINNGL